MGDVRTSSAPYEQGNLFEQREQKKVTINTIQYTALVDRLCINKRKFQDIWSYDEDNLYPNKVRASWLRSPSAKSASGVFSKFVTGEGFEGDDIELNDGLTPKKILRFAAEETSIFHGFAILVNYNIFGQKTGFDLAPFEINRISIDEDFIYQKRDWSTIYNGGKEKFYKFNDDPAEVRRQIEDAGGIDKYPGQIFYWKGTIRDIYTPAMCDSVLDDMQLEHEIGVYNLMNIQNNYPMSSIIKVATNMRDAKTRLETEMKLNEAKGARNAGKAYIVEVPPPGDTSKDYKMVEPLTRDNIDGLFKFQKESARDDIFACYNQPQILSGLSKGGIFNQDQFMDAFDYYNSEVETWRKDIEEELSILFRNSIYKIPESIEIRPKEYIVSRTSGSVGSEQGMSEEDRLRKEAQASLKGTVGGVDGILAIQEKVSQGITQYDAGLKILTEIYGFEEQTAREILGEPIKTFEETETVEEE